MDHDEDHNDAIYPFFQQQELERVTSALEPILKEYGYEAALDIFERLQGVHGCCVSLEALTDWWPEFRNYKAKEQAKHDAIKAETDLMIANVKRILGGKS